MGINYSPRIVTRGLVFAYDMYNTDKSWKGAPATNAIFASPTWAGDGTDQGAFAGGSVEITDPNLMYNGLKTFLYSPKSSLNCYLQGSGSDFPGGNPSTVWTFSCYVKREDGAAISSMNVYMYYPSSDGAAAGTVEDVGNGWYRIYRTRTGASNDIGLAGFTSMAGSVKYYLSGAMLTKTDAPVRPLAGTASRSTTQAVLDLSTSHNTTTATSLTYASDDTFSFNGTSDYISVGDVLPRSTVITNDITLSAWIYPTRSTNYILGRGQSNSNYGQYSLTMSGGFLRFGNHNTTNGSASYTGGAVTLNNWNHVAISIANDGTTVSTVNGSAAGSWAALDGTNFSDYVSGNELEIGHWFGTPVATNDGYWFQGSISKVALYNSALTEAELVQNFNAHRGRFGI